MKRLHRGLSADSRHEHIDLYILGGVLSAVRGLITNVNENPDSVDVPNSAFRYSDGQWIFNMATSNLTSTTTYTYKINLSYGSVTFKIGIK